LTTIAARAGVIAADSRETWSSEDGGSRVHLCKKLFRKRIGKGRRAYDVILGTAGESAPGMIFVDWYGSGLAPPLAILAEGDFTILILKPKGIYVSDAYCREVPILEKFFAVGSGASAALAAMHCGKSAREAVVIASRIDPYTGGRVFAERV
jgi:hypothetical protein